MMNFVNIAPFLTLAAAVIGLVFAAYKFYWVKAKPEGTPQMSGIAAKIRKGAMAYLKRQYKTVSIFFICMLVILCVMAGLGMLTWFVPFAFLSGGFFSGLSGFVGMKIATYANTRTANGAQQGLNKGLKIAFSSGTVMGLTVVGLVLGVNGVVGMLAGALVSGFVVAIMMANSGGAWDNAKKYIEAGNFGGKGSENHKAAVVGDTVGDPFKDTSGPSVNILIKLLTMVSIVFAGLIVKYNLFDIITNMFK